MTPYSYIWDLFCLGTYSWQITREIEEYTRRKIGERQDLRRNYIQKGEWDA